MTLIVRDLRKTFDVGGGPFGPPRKRVRAIDGVSLTVPKGASVGLVGESGCGKSTVARAILRLIEPDSGSVTFDGDDVRAATPSTLRELRKRMQIVFQDPFASLNPRRTVRQTLAEPLRVHGWGREAQIAEKVRAAVEEVGLRADALDRLPHEFSGGQRQRIGIARALIVDPELVIADEPVSALDVSIQAQILTLLTELRRKRGIAFLFVSHDLGVVRHFCEQVCVMYLGRIVERGPTPAVLDSPAHPYTRLLRDSSPVPDPARGFVMEKLAGEVPSPADPPAGCHFHPRCPHAIERCRIETPAARPAGTGREAACHLIDEGMPALRRRF